MRLTFSFPVLLTILFVVLQCCGVIAWPIFWLFSPLVFAAALWLVFIVICFIVVIACRTLDTIYGKDKDDDTDDEVKEGKNAEEHQASTAEGE